MRILSLSGFIPEQICDIVRFNGFSGENAISHYCQYAADFISQVLNDNTIDGAVFPKSCDSTRIIKSYLGVGKKKFIYQLPVPARQDEVAINYFSLQIKAYKHAIEEYFGIEIKDIEKRIEAVNKRNKSLKTQYDNLENISYGDYLKSIHKMLTKPLFEQFPEEIKPSHSGDKRVFLIGSYLTSEKILEVLTNSGFKVVGDNLPESGRLITRKPCEIDGDIYINIAKSILSSRLSPTQNNFKEIIKTDISEIKSKKAEGVIFLAQKYCEPYDYLYSVYRKALDFEGIKCVKISTANQEDSKKLELALEAFSDVI